MGNLYALFFKKINCFICFKSIPRIIKASQGNFSGLGVIGNTVHLAKTVQLLPPIIWKQIRSPQSLFKDKHNELGAIWEKSAAEALLTE